MAHSQPCTPRRRADAARLEISLQPAPLRCSPEWQTASNAPTGRSACPCPGKRFESATNELRPLDDYVRAAKWYLPHDWLDEAFPRGASNCERTARSAPAGAVIFRTRLVAALETLRPQPSAWRMICSALHSRTILPLPLPRLASPNLRQPAIPFPSVRPTTRPHALRMSARSPVPSATDVSWEPAPAPDAPSQVPDRSSERGASRCKGGAETGSFRQPIAHPLTTSARGTRPAPHTRRLSQPPSVLPL